ncbi:cell wall protein DAN4-like [Teratosphaeria destructans]|uniref:Cell wall protein DAN4-like n=1 Tax=Teratosphaeria destructans TaxID=418781 RepID=A0A9W7SVU7_9PEZI|nr:cell wall protein DAN4-like [Teratosphaeria destructans]
MSKGGVGRVRFVGFSLWLLICDWPSAATGAGDSATIPTTSASPTDGLGLAYAEKCQAELYAYNNESLAYYSTAPPATETYANTLTETSISEAPTRVTSLTTLCDGHPRVVGHADHGEGYTSVYVTAYTNTNILRQTSFTRPPPCSIGPNDCALLWSSWSSHYGPLASAGQLTEGVLNPPCTTSTLTHSYTTNSAGKACNNCQIVASYARLLYWPVTTAPGSGDLCGKPASLLPAPTRTVPNTFVTSNLTLTSPTVALSIALLSRADDCGPVVTDTIIPVRPEEVYSVRGDRALFQHYPFNYADLNWHCADGEYASEGDHPDCYQEVPADAYFDGTLRWAALDAMNVDWRKDKNLTIYNDYQPQILPPKTMTDAIARIWGPSCAIHPNGVWDPPKALQSADTQIGVAWGPAKATPTPVPEESFRAQTSRGPASRTGLSTYITATALPENTPAAQTPSGNGGSTPPQSVASQGTGEASAQTSGSAPQVVVIQSVTYTHVTQSGGLDALTNSETCLTLATATTTGASGNFADSIAAGIGMSRESGASPDVDTEPASRPSAVMVISDHTYTVVTASDNCYVLVGNETSITLQAATSMQSGMSTGSMISTSTPASAPTSSSAAGSFRYSLGALSAATLMQILLHNLG